MESTMQIPLGQQEHLKDFFHMMKMAGREEQAKDIEELLRYLDELKNGFSDALEEIDYLKEQIDAMQNQSLKARLGKMQDTILESIQQTRQNAEEVSHSIKEGIGQVLAAGQRKGIQAATALLDASHIRQGLSRIEAGLMQTSVFLSGAAKQTEDVANEIHFAKEHVKAAGNMVLGKPKDAFGEREAYQGILGKIQKSMEYCQKVMNGLVSKTQKARAHIEHFCLSAEKGDKRIPAVEEIEREFKQAAGMEFSTNNRAKEARQ